MTTRLNQRLVDGAVREHPPGAQLYCDTVPGLRIKVGQKSASYRYVGTCNDGRNTPVSLTIGRTDAMTLKQAQQQARELKLQLSKGDDPRKDRRRPVIPTVAEALEDYLTTRKDLSLATVKWYRTMVEGPLKSLAKRRMDELSRDECRRTHERVTEKSGPYLANGAMRCLKALHNDVSRTHDLPPNPVSRAVKMNRERPRDAAVLPEDMPDMWAALNEIEDPMRRTAWTMCVLTGLRSGDVRSARWPNLKDGVLFVPEPKGSRSFHLPLPSSLMSILEELREHTRPWESDFMFPARSRSGHLETLRRSPAFDYHPHQFRHGLRSYGLLAGVDEQVIKLILNHKDASVTGGYLTKAVALEPMRRGIEAISETLLSYRT